MLLKTARERLAVPLGRAAAEFIEQEAWTGFGFARLDDHARERFSRSGRWLRDMAAVGRAMESLPSLGAALTGDDGERPLGLVAALLIARTASAGSVASWIRLARETPIRELRRHVRKAREADSDWPVDVEEGQIGDRPGPERPAADGTIPARREHAVGIENVPGQDDLPGRKQLSARDDPGESIDLMERRRVRLLVPAPIHAAFHESLELYKAVEGHEASVTSYVDALVAEACAGLQPPDMECVLLPDNRQDAAVEKALFRATGNWRQLPGHDLGMAEAGHGPIRGNGGGGGIRQVLSHYDNGNAQDADRMAGGSGAAAKTQRQPTDSDIGAVDSLESLRTYLAGLLTVAQDGSDETNQAARSVMSTDARDTIKEIDPGGRDVGDPDVRIRGLLALGDEIERRLGRLLARMGDAGAWKHLRFAGLGHYAEQRLGWARTSAQERACLARSLRDLPMVRAAYDAGRLRYGAALSISRILGAGPVDEDLQREWVQRGETSTVKRLRDEARALRLREVTGCFPGRPAICSDDCEPSGTREARHQSHWRPRPLSDVEWHDSLRRKAGTARERIRQLGREALRGEHPLVVLGLRLPEELAGPFLSAVESARRRLIDEVGRESLLGQTSRDEDGGEGHHTDIEGHGDGKRRRNRQEQPEEQPSLAAARMFSRRGLAVPAWAGLLALIEEFVETWDTAQSARRAREEAVHIRDGYRCMAPGCTSRKNLQEHHVHYRSQGGSDDLANRVCLCAFHHLRGEHGELLSCRGAAPLGIEWSLGRGGSGGLFRNEMRLKG